MSLFFVTFIKICSQMYIMKRAQQHIYFILCCFFLLVFFFPTAHAKEIFNGYVYGFEQRVFDGQPISFTVSGGRLRVLTESEQFIVPLDQCRGNEVFTFCLIAYYEDSCLAHNPSVSTSPKCVLGADALGTPSSAARISVDKKDPKLTISSTLSNATLFVGEAYKVKLTLKNEGELVIRDLRIDDIYPREIIMTGSNLGTISRNSFSYERPTIAVGETVELEYTIVPQKLIETTQLASISYRAGGVSYEVSHKPITIKIQEPLGISLLFLDSQDRVVTPDINKTYTLLVNLTNKRPSSTIVSDLHVVFPTTWDVKQTSNLVLSNNTYTFDGQIRDFTSVRYTVTLRDYGPFNASYSYSVLSNSYSSRVLVNSVKSPLPSKQPQADFTVDLLIPRNGEFLEKSSTAIGVIVKNTGSVPLNDVLVVLDAGEFLIQSFEVDSLAVGETLSYNSDIISLPLVASKKTYPISVSGYYQNLTRQSSKSLSVFALSESLLFSVTHQKNPNSKTEYTVTQSVKNVLRQPIREVEITTFIPQTVQSSQDYYYRYYPLIDSSASVTLNAFKVDVLEATSATFATVATLGDLQSDSFAYLVDEFEISNPAKSAGELSVKVGSLTQIPYLDWTVVEVTYQNPSQTRFFDIRSSFFSQNSVGKFETSNQLADLASGERVVRKFLIFPYLLNQSKLGTLWVSYRDEAANSYVLEVPISGTVKEQLYEELKLQSSYDIVGSDLLLQLENENTYSIQFSFPYLNSSSNYSILPNSKLNLTLGISELEAMRIFANGLSLTIYERGAEIPLKLDFLRPDINLATDLVSQSTSSSTQVVNQTGGQTSNAITNSSSDNLETEVPAIVVESSYRGGLFGLGGKINIFYIYIFVLFGVIVLYVFWRIRE
jgi:hypothetical protein